MIKGIVVLFFVLTSPLIAEPLHFESGTDKNTLVELFTSEGCSSCPPAEKYLNSLKNKDELWKKWIPVAFHVDYWDYIGWKDEYATKEFGYRQSRYASLRRASTVYTPAFMVNGESWRRGIFSSSVPDEEASAGNLIVALDGKNVTASYQSGNKKRLKLNVAVLGMGLISHIERGENEGRTAKHEFVVVGLNSTVSENLKWDVRLPKLHYSKAKEYALAVWVSDVDDPTPLQVTGGVLPDYK